MIATIDIVIDPEITSAAQDLILTAVLAILGLLGSALTFGIGYASKRIMAWLQAKAERAKSDAKTAKIAALYEAFRCMTQKLDTISTNAVAEVEHTLVRQLKRDKDWNDDTARGARDTAVEIMKRHFGEQGLLDLKECSGLAMPALEGLLRTWVENKVRAIGGKSAMAPIVPMNEPTGD